MILWEEWEGWEGWEEEEDDFETSAFQLWILSFAGLCFTISSGLIDAKQTVT
jgi:hypothetical protein